MASLNCQLSEQLSMYGLKPTARMSQSDHLGQLMIDVLELSENPKQLMTENYERR